MSYSVWQSYITNGLTVLSGATVSVFHEVSGAPAALFSSPSGGSIGSSVTSDSAGLARFYVAAGVYRITVTHATFSAEHRHVRIGEMAGVDDAPSDGKKYTRKNSAWSEETGGFVESVEADEDNALGFIFDNTNPANPLLTTELPGYLRPHRIGYSTEQYTELYYDNISFYRGGDYPYFARLIPNYAGTSVNATLPAESGTLARLEDLPDAIKKTSALTSSSGVVTIDCADGIDKHTLTLSENVTSWSFTNRPTGADYIVKIVAVTQDASTARTCVSPATKTAGSAWTVSSTLSSEEWLELWIGASDVYLRASGTMV